MPFTFGGFQVGPFQTNYQQALAVQPVLRGGSSKRKRKRRVAEETYAAQVVESIHAQAREDVEALLSAQQTEEIRALLQVAMDEEEERAMLICLSYIIAERS